MSTETELKIELWLESNPDTGFCSRTEFLSSIGVSERDYADYVVGKLFGK